MNFIVTREANSYVRRSGDNCSGPGAGFARALVHGSPSVAEIRARGGVDPERVVEALRDALPREFGTAPTRLPLQAIVFEGRRS